MRAKELKNVAMFPIPNVQLSKRLKSSKGDAERCSCHKNKGINMANTAKPPITCWSPQPSSPPSDKAMIRPAKATKIMMPPYPSTFEWGRVRDFSLRIQRPQMRAMIPKGTLDQNTHLQPQAVVTMPPTTGPSTCATEADNIFRPSPVPSCDWGNASVISGVVFVTTSAPPAACTIRRRISISTLGAKPSNRLDMVKIAIPDKYIRLLPNISEICPKIKIRMVFTSI